MVGKKPNKLPTPLRRHSPIAKVMWGAGQGVYVRRTAQGMEKHRGSITNRREGLGQDLGVLDLSQQSPSLCGCGHLWAHCPQQAPRSSARPNPLLFGSWRQCPLPPSLLSQAWQCPRVGLRGKGGPSSEEDATPTALIALIPRRG